jgi:hypothetical protein
MVDAIVNAAQAGMGVHFARAPAGKRPVVKTKKVCDLGFFCNLFESFCGVNVRGLCKLPGPP